MREALLPMDLKLLSVTVEADGFRVDAKNSGLIPDTLLTLHYELSSGWVSKDVEFEPEPPTLFHPFRKSMFVYTGEPARRVLVSLKDGSFLADFQFDAGARDEFFEENNFYVYPDFDDVIWQGNDYASFFPGGDGPPPDAPPEGQDVPLPEPAVDLSEQTPTRDDDQGAPPVEGALDLPGADSGAAEPNAY